MPLTSTSATAKLSRKFHPRNKFSDLTMCAVMEIYYPGNLHWIEHVGLSHQNNNYMQTKPSVVTILEKLNIKESLKEKIKNHTGSICKAAGPVSPSVLRVRRGIGRQPYLGKLHYKCKRMQKTYGWQGNKILLRFTCQPVMERGFRDNCQ